MISFPSRARLSLAVLAALSALAAPGASAQEYPARPIRIIVPFPAGGTADVMPRIFADKLSQKWGQPITVENRAGASGNIGAEAAYRAEPDGYTLLSAPPPPLVINQSLYPKLAFDPTQFAPISIMGAVPNVALINPRVPASTLPELIAYAKANPGKLNYASQGSGSTSHLTAELFKSLAGGLNIQHVPYKGTAPALTDLLGGQVEIMFDNLGVSLPHVKSGKLKALGVAAERRIASMPGTPTIAETLPGFVSVAWFGVVAPPKTPPAITERFSAAIAEAARLPDVQKRMAELSADVIANTPAQMGAFMREDAERWRKVIVSAGVKPD
jgi:tripartite-type tricarboxylate transporter receptor subunit TctC